MTKAPDRQKRFSFISEQKAKLAAVPNVVDSRDYDMWRTRKGAAEAYAMQAIMRADGTVRAEGDVTLVQFGGLRATSTAGLNGALSNWLAQAHKKWGLS